jgi:hypothetical protein
MNVMSFQNYPRLTIVFRKLNVSNDDLIAAYVSSEANTCLRSNNAKTTSKVAEGIIPRWKLKRFVNFYMH